MPSRSGLTAVFACNQSDARITVVERIHVQHRDPFTAYDETPPFDDSGFEALPPGDELLPQVVGEEFRHRLGTRPLDLTNWLPADRETAPTIAMKRELLAERRDEVVSLFPGGDDVAQEAGELVSRWAGCVSTRNGIDALIDAALLVADDLMVLKPSHTNDDEELLFVAGVVCAPSRWRLADKMGMDMLKVHQPVPKYSEHIGAVVNTALQRLAVERPVWRSNWTLMDHPALFQPTSPAMPLAMHPDELWIRIERETFRRLPQTAGLLFTIREFQQPLVDYVRRGRDVARTLRTLLQRLPDDVARYKSILPYRTSTIEWLERFC